MTIVIHASARRDGNTLTAMDMALEGLNLERVNLGELNISYFDYEHANQDDDFLPLAEKMIAHDAIILATPVYWYSMSAPMKTFFDRFSDLITIRKDLGRALEGKQLFLITTYGGDFPICLEAPIRLTCQYLKMSFQATFYHYSGNDPVRIARNPINAQAFRQQLLGVAQ